MNRPAKAAPAHGFPSTSALFKSWPCRLGRRIAAGRPAVKLRRTARVWCKLVKAARQADPHHPKWPWWCPVSCPPGGKQKVYNTCFSCLLIAANERLLNWLLASFLSTKALTPRLLCKGTESSLNLRWRLLSHLWSPIYPNGRNMKEHAGGTLQPLQAAHTATHGYINKGSVQKRQNHTRLTIPVVPSVLVQGSIRNPQFWPTSSPSWLDWLIDSHRIVDSPPLPFKIGCPQDRRKDFDRSCGPNRRSLCQLPPWCKGLLPGEQLVFLLYVLWLCYVLLHFAHLQEGHYPSKRRDQYLSKEGFRVFVSSQVLHQLHGAGARSLSSSERCQKPSGTFIKIIKTFRQSLRNAFAAACFDFADPLHPTTSFANPFAEFLLLTSNWKISAKGNHS